MAGILFLFLMWYFFWRDRPTFGKFTIDKPTVASTFVVGIVLFGLLAFVASGPHLRFASLSIVVVFVTGIIRIYTSHDFRMVPIEQTALTTCTWAALAICTGFGCHYLWITAPALAVILFGVCAFSVWLTIREIRNAG